MLARLISPRLLLMLLAAFWAVHAPLRLALAQEEEEESSDEEEAGTGEAGAADADQPPVTSGGRYTLETYPISELERTLTLIQGVFEGRADIRFDLTKGQTFETWTLVVDGRYGLTDTMQGEVGTNLILAAPEGASKTKSIFAAVEGSIMYDLIDWRIGADLVVDPDTSVDFFAGLPLKIRVYKDKIAILALEKVLTIYTNKIADKYHKPDLTVSVGGLFQAMNNLAIVLRGTIIYKSFEGDPIIPVELDLQFTPSNRFDVGVALVLDDVGKSQSNFDSRSAGIFARFRL